MRDTPTQRGQRSARLSGGRKSHAATAAAHKVYSSRGSHGIMQNGNSLPARHLRPRQSGPTQCASLSGQATPPPPTLSCCPAKHHQAPPSGAAALVLTWRLLPDDCAQPYCLTKPCTAASHAMPLLTAPAMPGQPSPARRHPQALQLHSHSAYCLTKPCTAPSQAMYSFCSLSYTRWRRYSPRSSLTPLRAGGCNSVSADGVRSERAAVLQVAGWQAPAQVLVHAAAGSGERCQVPGARCQVPACVS